MTTDTNPTQSDKANRKITSIDLNFTNLPPRAGYFVVSVWRGDWTTNDCRCRNYYRPSRASLLRVNRAQRLLIRRVVNGYVAAPAVTVEPENSLELGQLITNEFEAAEQPVRMCADPDCLNAADPTTPGGAYCIACAVTGRAELGVTPRWTAEQMIEREG